MPGKKNVNLFAALLVICDCQFPDTCLILCLVQHNVGLFCLFSFDIKICRDVILVVAYFSVEHVTVNLITVSGCHTSSSELNEFIPTVSLFGFQSLKMSRCPQELEPADRTTPVHVNVMKRLEDYRVNPPPFIDLWLT